MASRASVAKMPSKEWWALLRELDEDPEGTDPERWDLALRVWTHGPSSAQTQYDQSLPYLLHRAPDFRAAAQRVVELSGSWSALLASLAFATGRVADLDWAVSPVRELVNSGPGSTISHHAYVILAGAWLERAEGETALSVLQEVPDSSWSIVVQDLLTGTQWPEPRALVPIIVAALHHADPQCVMKGAEGAQRLALVRVWDPSLDDALEAALARSDRLTLGGTPSPYAAAALGYALAELGETCAAREILDRGLKKKAAISRWAAYGLAMGISRAAAAGDAEWKELELLATAKVAVRTGLANGLLRHGRGLDFSISIQRGDPPLPYRDPQRGAYEALLEGLTQDGSKGVQQAAITALRG